ncbi:hypothetical protein [Mucilaginibacter dorajii]|nr:hypothetical protein [Mucilaginibacter dorajii]MCS3733404.1 hypothetical protein [Mucilaginibacter dorajii]
MNRGQFKNFSFLLILFLLTTVCKADDGGKEGGFKCHLISGCSTKKISKPNLSLFIDRADLGIYAMGNPEQFLHITYFLINNSDDTVKYVGAGCLTSRFFHIDNPDITIIDNNWPPDSTEMLLIPPHRGIEGNLIGKFKLRPVSAFKFKVGISLLKWGRDDIPSILKKVTISGANVLWSDVETVEVENKHYNYKRDIANIKARWLKRPMDAFFPPLTKTDRDKYSISIDENKIAKLRDSIVYDLNISKRSILKRKCLVTMCPVKLNNNSKDTLEYINMKCSWTDIYKPDNNKFSVVKMICYSNFPTTIKVFPDQSITIYVPIKTFDLKNRNTKIKIGMNLYKYWSNDQLHMFNPDELMLRPETNNMVWSNEILVK